MEIIPSENTIYLQQDTVATLRMSQRTLNTLRCFLGDALESGTWEEDSEEQRLIWELHDAIVVMHRNDYPGKISPDTDWRRQRDAEETVVHNEARQNWIDLGLDPD